MARLGLTKQMVFDAAFALSKKGITPTQEATRTFLGRGSKGTIHKYLNEWKKACFQKGLLGDNTDWQAILKAKQELEFIVNQQLEQNENLTSQLIEAEQKLAQAQIKLKHLENELQQAKALEQERKLAFEGLQQSHQAVVAERTSAIDKIINDKNQLIDSLRQELKELNEASLKAVKEIGLQGDEALMLEKVKNIHLNDKVRALEKQISPLEQQLKGAQIALEPLKRELTRQRAIIERFVSFEDLQSFQEGG